MNTKHFFFGTLTLLVCAIAALPAEAGKTANGCTYDVVNGKYFYSCPGGASASTESTSASAGAVAQAEMQSYPAEPSRPQEVVSPSLPRDSRDYNTLQGQTAYRAESYERESSFTDSFYLGGGLGSTSFLGADTMKGSALAYGVQIGTNVNDYIGLELAYNYAKTDLYLGLEQRAGGRIVTPFSRSQGENANANAQDLNPPLNNTDSTLSVHLVTLEGLFYLTRAESRFRPFAGVGLGYKAATLSEDFPVGTSGASNASVSQSSFGPTAGIGAKFRFSDHFQIAAAFRFFIPFSTSEPEWTSQPSPPRGAGPGATANAQTANGTAAASQYMNSRGQNYYSGADTKLTGGALSQIGATIQYVF